MRVHVGVLLAVTVLGGCSGSTEPAAPTTTSTTASSTTYELVPRTVRPDEVALRGEAVVEGSTSFSLIGLSTGMPTLIGSHAEFEAEGQFVRVRLVVVNVGRSSVLFDTKRQLLVLADGGTHAPHRSTMITKRQPDTFDLGAGVRVEFDLYYDVPVDVEPAALRAFGGATLTDMKDEQGTDLPLTPAP
jgi:hypothetical protein